MASRDKKWFFNRYQDLLKKMGNKEDLELTEPAMIIGENLIERARSLAPKGVEEISYTSLFDGGQVREAEKASQRRGATSLEAGWRLKIREAKGDVSIQLGSVTPHAKWVVHGTEPHRIPLQGFAKPLLFFFWADRTDTPTGRRWGPSASGHEGGASWRRFEWVDHPGALPNLFLEKAKEEIRKPGKDELTEKINNWLILVHRNSGFYEGRP